MLEIDLTSYRSDGNSDGSRTRPMKTSDFRRSCGSERMLARVDCPARKIPKDISQTEHRPAAWRSTFEGLFLALSAAVGAGLICKLTFSSRSGGRPVCVNVLPLVLLYKDRHWYLRAWSVRHAETRIFHLGRVVRIEVSDDLSRRSTRRRRRGPDGEPWS